MQPVVLLLCLGAVNVEHSFRFPYTSATKESRLIEKSDRESECERVREPGLLVDLGVPVLHLEVLWAADAP